MKSLFLTAVLALLLLSAPTIYACSCVVLQFLTANRSETNFVAHEKKELPG